MAESGRRRRDRGEPSTRRDSAAARFASGLPGSPPARSPSLRRRVVLLLLPGIACIVVALVGAAVIDHLEDGDRRGVPEEPATPDCTPSSSQPGPDIDLGIESAGGRPPEAGQDQPRYSPLDRARVDRLVARAGRAGATTISTSARWRDLQPRRSSFYRWDRLDRVVDAARSAGLKVRLEVGTTPAFALDGGADEAGPWRPPLTEEELGRWAGHLTTLTQHVSGRVDYIEVWSEPNRQQTWTTGPDPEAFARLMAVSYQAITSVDPTIAVVSGGLRNNDVGFLRATYEARDALYGRDRALFDQLGVHPFAGDRAPSEGAAPASVVDGRFGPVDNRFLGFGALREVMGRNGDATKAVYVTAFGYSTEPRGKVAGVPDVTRATYLTEAFEAATCADMVSALSWYAYLPSPLAAPGWALVGRDGQGTETFRSLRRWAARVGASA